MSGRPAALVPVRSPATAKGRLAGVLDPGERRELALATMHTVVEAAWDGGFEPLVLTASPSELPPPGRGRLIPERPGVRGLNDALEGALRDLGPVGRLLVLHGDLPLVTGGALRRLTAALPPRGPGVVLARSRDGGTNAMLLAPPGRFALAYGPASFRRHVAAAFAAGMAVEAVDDRALSLDLDVPADLAALLGTPGGASSPAGRLLARWGVGERLRSTAAPADPPPGGS